MKFTKALTTMAVITIVSLIYIQLQVQIIDLAYQGNAKDSEIQRLQDDNGQIRHDIHALKSTNNLGVKLLGDNSDMRFVDKEHIVRLNIPRTSVNNKLASSAADKRQTNFFANMFSLKSQAEAKTIK